ncbi:MAG: glycyl-radical enzyme activating protein [Syntrophobacter sp.]
MDMRPYVFNIQRYCIQDGPGLRTTVFFKGCPLRCAWCSNPESQSSSREILHFDKLCVRCGECMHACAKKAISVSREHYVLDRFTCDLCGDCIRACPKNALEFSGNRYSVRDLLSLSLKDRLFWEQSGGGITVSGGEPLLHQAFLSDYLKALKEEGVQVAMETSGLAGLAAIRAVSEYVDLFIYDIKHLDDNRHIAMTGVSNSAIIQNCRWLLENNRPVLIRVPVIPSFNMDDGFFRSLALLISELHIYKVDLLPFHRLGAAKYEALGREYRFSGQEPLTEGDLLPYATGIREATGCTITIDGSEIDDIREAASDGSHPAMERACCPTSPMPPRGPGHIIE